MKKLFSLVILAVFLVACGGGETHATNAQTSETVTNVKFDAPPSPGSKN